MIRVDALWLAVEPLDMRAGTEAALGVISDFVQPPRSEAKNARPLNDLARLDL